MVIEGLHVGQGVPFWNGNHVEAVKSAQGRQEPSFLGARCRGDTPGELNRQIIPAFSRGGATCVDVMDISVERFWSGAGGLQQRWKLLGQLLYLWQSQSSKVIQIALENVRPEAAGRRCCFDVTKNPFRAKG